MWAKSEILNKCEQLRSAGYSPKLRVGMFVARGFADVGAEVFTVYPGHKLLSLFSGKIAPIDDAEEDKLFHVPTVDEAERLLAEKGVSFELLRNVDEHRWGAQVEERTFKADTLQELFLDLLLYSCGAV